MNQTLLIITWPQPPAAAFLLVLTSWLIITLLWAGSHLKRRKKIEERLDLRSTVPTRTLRIWREGKIAATTVAAPWKRRPIHSWLLRLIQRSGLNTTPAALSTIVGVACLAVTGLVYLLLGDLWVALASPVLFLLVTNIYLNHRILKRDEIVEKQLLDSMHVASTSLRAGHPLTGALSFVAQEVEPPMGELFQEIWDNQQLGVDLSTAMRDAAEKSGNNDMKLLSASVSAQAQSGGNLADMMERLSSVIRDRVRRRRRLRVITAQTQFAKRVLLAFPFLFVLIMNTVYPGYTDPLFTSPGGKIAVIVAGGLLVVGAFVMNRMTKLDY
ncbi:MAG: type II secretion system F family protein [Planctomycetota bacterium]